MDGLTQDDNGTFSYSATFETLEQGVDLFFTSIVEHRAGKRQALAPLFGLIARRLKAIAAQ